MTTLVVTDLDGTLWDNTLTCHPDVLAAVAELQDRPDVELLVATGRRRNSARRAFAVNDLTLPSILLNGAIGFDFKRDRVFHEVAFIEDNLRSVLAMLQEFSLGPVAYLSDTRALAVAGVTTSARHLDSLGDDLVWSSFDYLAERPDVLGMSMLGIEVEAVEHALDDLAALEGVEMASYADHLYPPYSLMLAPQGINKAVGIEAYLKYRKIKPDRIIALGDGGNDLEMMQMADVALAVEGADPRATELADHIIAGPTVGGWASVLGYL